MSFSLMKTKKQAIDVWSVKSLETTHARKKYKAPDFGGPGQPFGEGHPLWWRMRNRWRHHLVPFQGESLGLDWVVIVVVVVLILTGIIRLVRVLFIECIKIVLFNQCLYEEKSEEVKKSETNESGLLVLRGTLCSRRARFCCCSMRSEAEAGGEAALILRTTRILSSGRGGRHSVSRLWTLMVWSCSNPPSVNWIIHEGIPYVTCNSPCGTWEMYGFCHKIQMGPIPHQYALPQQ